MMHVLVTGGARRIGRAISLMVAADGGVPVIHCNRSAGEAETLRDDIIRSGGKAHVVRGDLSRTETMDALFDEILSRTGGCLDAIVNNASLYAPTGQGSACRAIHVLSPLALIRRLAALGSGKAVVNILDTRSRDDAHAEYMAAKNEMRDLTISLARELAPSVRVCGVAAGAVLQEDGQPESELERLSAFNPLRAHGTPEGLAECVRFLLKSDFITGEIIHYDGGYHLKQVEKLKVES
jgi:NAD(P)-dependent dehydrogenase (short-subunit alcohol dehydrogenase family)